MATASKVADVMHELEEQNRMVLWAMSAEAEQISGNLETRVEELAQVLYSKRVSHPVRSRASGMGGQDSQSGGSLQQHSGNAGSPLSLLQVFDERAGELDMLRASGGAMPHGITGANGICGSHHYFLDLTREEAEVMVALHHGVFAMYPGNIPQAYERACSNNACLCSA